MFTPPETRKQQLVILPDMTLQLQRVRADQSQDFGSISIPVRPAVLSLVGGGGREVVGCFLQQRARTPRYRAWDMSGC